MGMFVNPVGIVDGLNGRVEDLVIEKRVPVIFTVGVEKY